MGRVIEEIPKHLQPFTTKQDYSLYTPIDHACWRYIMRVSKAFFKKHAHQKYLDGIKETGISTDRIPKIEEMDQSLRKFGWRAVGVVGFIPPAVFMEFQSLGILPIACDMRSHEHVDYTPAPDIVHEAAGHAPIIADEEYAQYLRNYGEVARKAIFSQQDMDVYEAIRNLSIVKEAPNSTEEDIKQSQKRLDEAIATNSYISEATYLARMNWWTVEYGLVGDSENPLIYGAGLLSSVGESFSCLEEAVKKLPLTLDCLNTSYDITKPQPQLFVTPSFKHLTKILNKFSATMAFKVGGLLGLAKAKFAETVTTTVLDSGIQISGKLKDFITNGGKQPKYLMFEGPSQLCFDDQEIPNQGTKHHPEGFGTPIGLVKGLGKSAAHLTKEDLTALGFVPGSNGTLEFESGVKVTGELTNSTSIEGQLVLHTFKNCKVTLGERVLFEPSWGTFDMACGEKVTSVFGGPADRSRYLASIGSVEQIQGNQKTNRTESNAEQNLLFDQVRSLREKGNPDANSLLEILQKSLNLYPSDWLLPLEILELASDGTPAQTQAILKLEELSKVSKTQGTLIKRGLDLLS